MAATRAATSPPRDAADVLALGFGTTVGMWAAGYVCRMPGMSVPGWLLLALLVLCLLVGGWLAGRYSPRGWRGGLLAGLLTGTLNLLILGGLLAEPESGSLRRLVWLWAPASVVATGLMAGAGATLAQGRPARAVSPAAFRSAFALVAAAATLLLIAAGGMVTGFEAGLAVPDWPNSFGYNMFLYPLARMTGGIYYEHSHRLLGSLVGLTTVALAASVWISERDALRRGLAAAAALTVIVQGVLGGLRVTGRFTLSAAPEDLAPNDALAIVHGVLAQVFLALLIVLAVVLSPGWRAGRPQASSDSARIDRRLGLAALPILILQLVLGALLRHTGTQWTLVLHITMAVFVLLVVGAFAVRAWSIPEGGVLPRLGGSLLVLLGVQLAAGFAALLVTTLDSAGRPAPLQVAVTTLHQTVGAALLAVATALSVWHYPSPAPSPRPRVFSSPPGGGRDAPSAAAAGRLHDRAALR
jgi:cytochrome c oxidase assembly protein subunit 15